MVDPLVIFLAKSLTMPKKTERYVLVPPGIVCYAEKKLFLVQIPAPTGTIL